MITDIATLREKLVGLTTTEIQALAECGDGLSWQAIYKIQKGITASPKFETVQKISDALKKWGKSKRKK